MWLLTQSVTNGRTAALPTSWRRWNRMTVNKGLMSMYSVDTVVTTRMISSTEAGIGADERRKKRRLGLDLTSLHSYCGLSGKRLFLK